MAADSTDGKTKRADATRAALMAAAERLIAQKGIAEVSTRDILKEAGQKNQSALQYHFGSRGALINSAINARTHQLDAYREALMDALSDKPSLYDVLVTIVRPLCNLVEDDEAGKNYIIFLSQAITQPDWDLRQAIIDYKIVILERTYQVYDALLSHLPDQERLLRQDLGFDLMILTLKRWCVAKTPPDRSLHELEDFIINAIISVIEADYKLPEST
ncbi:MAG: hypothetical protein COB37_00635 [Kordiimonadales bacterium]|nr:MAG: hypothetical protein COB37_00635 [Kordiimonadales bacterium]